MPIQWPLGEINGDGGDSEKKRIRGLAWKNHLGGNSIDKRKVLCKTRKKVAILSIINKERVETVLYDALEHGVKWTVNVATV